MPERYGLWKGWRDSKTIALVTLDTLFWSKKTIFVGLISFFVLALALLGRLILSYQWVNAPFTPAQVFGTLMSTAVLHFLVVFVTLFYGTALISEEVEGKTITYLFVRPIPKNIVMLGKYLALLWICMVMVLPVVVLSYCILYLRTDLTPFFEDMHLLGKDIGILFLAMLAYGALFSLIGAWLKHSILAGLVYAFGWEGIVSYLPGFTRKLTITHYVQSIFPHQDTAGAIAMLIGQRTDTAEAVLMLILLAAFFLGSASIMLREKE
ncbi:MAG: ABC transporter permease, partial [Acidobacteria bacterium]|nr:ABC transporter permease [Acidobacteriota bacterium]